MLTRSERGVLATVALLAGALADEPGSVQGQAAPAQRVAREEAPRWIEACGRLDDASRAALGDVEAAMADPSAPLSTIEARLDEMRQTPCFALAAVVDDLTPFVSSGVARAWWLEGGQDWASQFVAFASGHRDELVLAPSRRPTLGLETAPPGDPLRGLLCAEADADCGRETAGWMMRAERAFEDHARAERLRDEGDDRDAGADGEGDDEEPLDCPAQARELDEGSRYAGFVACLEEVRPERSALPVGRMRAPTRGWLVVRGRRGHYQFRDELRAYDLATGAAYIVSSDSRLALRDDGTVDVAATDRARRVTAEAGRLSVEAVRELAWMLFVTGRVEERFAEVTTVPLPAGIPLRSHEDAYTFMGLHLSATFSSAWTQLDWVWIDAGGARISGDLTWPENEVAANDHAAQLLRIAEATFAPGCAPARLTALPRLWSPGGVSALDAAPDELARTEDVLLRRITELRAPACRRPER